MLSFLILALGAYCIYLMIREPFPSNASLPAPSAAAPSASAEPMPSKHSSGRQK